ncbi:MAG: hypothetical protein AB1801_25880 [Chloroflexota bacterium]
MRISTNTVGNHIASILAKLGAANRTAPVSSISSHSVPRGCPRRTPAPRAAAPSFRRLWRYWFSDSSNSSVSCVLFHRRAWLLSTL